MKVHFSLFVDLKRKDRAGSTMALILTSLVVLGVGTGELHPNSRNKTRTVCGRVMVEAGLCASPRC
jgi:hypothetical protein